MKERDVSKLLRSADRPRAPRPDFERALRAELATAKADHSELSIVELDFTEPRARRKVRAGVLALGAAAAAVALVLGIALTASGPSKSVRVSGKTKATVEAACRQFVSDAFVDVPRQRLLGPQNSRYLADSATARRRVQHLRDALITFRGDLSAAGIHSQSLSNALQIATNDADRALGYLNQGSLSRAPMYVQEVESRLVAAQIELTKLGVASCL